MKFTAETFVTIFLWQLFVLCCVFFHPNNYLTEFVVLGVQFKSDTLNLNDLMQILIAPRVS